MRRIALLILLAALPLKAADYTLKATPQTVVIGYYSAAAKPILTIHSGDRVVIETLSGSTAQYRRLGVPENQIPPALAAIENEVKDRGPGRHILTGPIYIEGAEPGDTLELHIEKIDLASPFAYNQFRPTSGFLPEDFPHPGEKLIPLDRQRMLARFAPGIEIPLHPFLRQHGHRTAARRRPDLQRPAVAPRRQPR
jgi:acetamidase/formamidase